MAHADEPRFAFLVEWFDPQASLIKQYNLLFWPASNMLEMYDIKHRRTFLKKQQYVDVSVDKLFIGATLNVYSRQLKVLDFADAFTKNSLSKQLARTVCFVKPSAQSEFGRTIVALQDAGFTLARLQTVQLSPSHAKALLGSGESTVAASDLCSGVGTALELVQDNAIEALQHLVKQAAEGDSMVKQLVVARDPHSYERMKSILFSKDLGSTAVESNCTMAVIKPHAVKEALSGHIITAIADLGFQILAAELFYLDRPAAEEFFDVYKGVIPQYCPLVEQWTSGPSIALQIQGGEDVVERLRVCAGPHDPEIGKHIRPQSLRARFGSNRVENALHVTDLAEDGVLESKFFFQILQDAKV